MTVFALAVLATLVLLCLVGFAIEAGIVAAGFLCACALLWLERRRLLTNGIDAGRSPSEVRRALDRIVLLQWLGAGVVSLGFALVAGLLSLDPLASVGRLLSAAVVACAVAAIGTYLSSLFDWAVILPKVSGLSGSAPCETGGGERWRYTTCFWFLHRAVATGVVYLAITGTFAFMAATAGGAATAVWTFLATATLLIAGYFFRGMFFGFIYSVNPPVMVGDRIRVEAPSDGCADTPVLHRQAYIVDVSLQGAKYKLLTDGRYRGARFGSKSDGIIDIEDLSGVRKVPPAEGDEELCSLGACSGVNWYCRHNRRAHD